MDDEPSPPWVFACYIRDLATLQHLVNASNVNMLAHAWEMQIRPQVDTLVLTRPLGLALRCGAYNIAEWLLSIGACVQADESPLMLHTLISQERVDWLRHVLIHGMVDLNACMITLRRTPLEEAFQTGNHDVIKLLIRAGASASPPGVQFPPWMSDYARGLDRCKRVAATLVGIRRFGRSPALQRVPLDVVKLMAKSVLATLGVDAWWK